MHAWKERFFKFGTVKFVAVDDNTEKIKTLDVARVLIRTKCHDIVNFVEIFMISDEMFVIKVIEDLHPIFQKTQQKF